MLINHPSPPPALRGRRKAMKVIITGTRQGQPTGGYMTTEMDNPRHPSKEFVKQAKINLNAHKISISIEDQPDRPSVWRG
jgi:hypothetical protein